MCSQNYQTSSGNTNHQFRSIGPSIRIFQLNVEGISKSKSDILSKMLEDQEIDVVALQETHTANETQLNARGNITGYTLIDAIYHRSYGSATYIKSSILNVRLIKKSSLHDIHFITIEVGGIKVANVYKPPNTAWPNEVLPTYEHPSVYIGDFNSHHADWCYSSNDANGVKLVDWATINNMSLKFDAKDKKTFHSARWQNDYNPDLCFVTNNSECIPLQSTRRVLNGFPHSQHRPVVIDIGIKIPIVSSIPKPRWNFAKADWKLFASRLDSNVRWIPPIWRNYDRFVGVVKSAAKKSVPRGFRDEYIPGWNENTQQLFEEFLSSGNTETADDLIYSLDNSRREIWLKTVESMDFKHSSRKAWSVIRKLGDAYSISSKRNVIEPNEIAKRIVSTSHVPNDRSHTKFIKCELTKLKNNRQPSSEFSEPFTLIEINGAIDQIKIGKAAGYDNMSPEFLKYCGKNTRLWLSKFFSNILETGCLPKLFKKSKIIAVLKPGKSNDKPENYRPIALLSTCYKLLERLIYNRISPVIEDNLPVEQAGFRPNRNCADQLLSLTSYIESGFQNKEKTGAVFVDLTAAFDTVWRDGLMYKFLKLIPCWKLSRLLNNMLSNRYFSVFLNDGLSGTKTLNNGLPQGSVLSPLLFNLYLNDLPNTTSRKFGYADDWTFAYQHQHMIKLEEVLATDLTVLNDYFKKWRLCVSVNKTESSCFHLNNKLANAALTVVFSGSALRFNQFPKYLGVTLDRTLSYRKHLENTSDKLKSRNNIIQKLAGTSWGASTHALRVSALGLVFPVAEYGASVWLNSAHTQLVDRQLNTTMRIITGTIQSTPLQWLPVLSNIAPSHLRREFALLREHRKINQNSALPIHQYYGDHIHQRLKSKIQPGRTATSLLLSDWNLEKKWEDEWTKNGPFSAFSFLLENPTEEVPGFNLSRRLWSTLNRIRTNHGRCADSFFKWGICSSPECDCGAPKQTISHITLECPLRHFNGTIEEVHAASPDFITWMKNLDLAI